MGSRALTSHLPHHGVNAVFYSASSGACSRRKCSVQGAGRGPPVLLQQQHHNQPHPCLDCGRPASPPPPTPLPLPCTCRRRGKWIWSPSGGIWSTLLILWSPVFLIWIQSGRRLRGGKQSIALDRLARLQRSLFEARAGSKNGRVGSAGCQQARRRCHQADPVDKQQFTQKLKLQTGEGEDRNQEENQLKKSTKTAPCKA